MKKVLFVVCACLMAVMLAACGSRGSAKTDQSTGSTAGATASSTSAVSAPDLPDKNGFDEATNTTVTKAGVTVQVPGYYGEADDKGNYYAERGSSVAMLMFGDEDLKGSTNDFSNNKEAIAKNFIKGIGNGAKIVESKDYWLQGCPDMRLASRSMRRELKRAAGAYCSTTKTFKNSDCLSSCRPKTRATPTSPILRKS